MQKTIRLPAQYLLVVVLMFTCYIIFSQVTTTLYLLYGLIAILAVLLHILVVKNFNVTFVMVNNFCCKPSMLFGKFFFAQMIVFLLSAWLVANLLAQGELNIRTSSISSNLMPNNFFIIAGSWINWVVFVGLLLGVNGCKHYFKYPDTWTLAKCLLPIISKQPWLSCYRMLLNIEAGTKINSLTTLFVILSAVLLEMISSQYKLFSFLQYPIITSFVIIMIFGVLIRHICKVIDFCSKKITIDFISIFMVTAVFAAIIIFILNQIVLEKIYLLRFKNINGVFINKFFNDVILNKDRIKILSLSVNILLSACSANLLLRPSKGHKVGIIYLASSIHPLIVSLMLYKPTIINNFISVLTTSSFSVFVILIVLAVLIINYKNIYSASDLITLKLQNKSKSQKTIKTSFNMVIKKIIFAYFLYLSSYYMFAWIIPMHVVAITNIFLVPSLVLLLLKVLTGCYTEHI